MCRMDLIHVKDPHGTVDDEWKSGSIDGEGMLIKANGDKQKLKWKNG